MSGLDLFRAMYHGCRALYFEAALRHVGHTHHDAPDLTRRAICARIEFDRLMAQ